MTTLTDDTPASPVAAPVRAPLKTPWLLVGGVAIATAGVAAGLAWRPDTPPPVEPVRMSSAVSADTAVAPGRVQDQSMADPAPRHDATRTTSSKPHAPAARHAPKAGATGSAETTPLATERMAVCASCGTVEGVRSVEQKGQGTGLGAVAGGVAGAALGNQFGHGKGRAAMTVLGAVGGGLAGNEVEKRARSETVYEVRVRMDDGSVRTLTQKAAPAPGARVTVEGNTLHTTRAPQGAGTMVRTSTGA